MRVIPVSIEETLIVPDPPDPVPHRTAADDAGDRAGAEDPRLVATKQQVAIVRMLADEIERCLGRGSVAPPLRDRLVHELSRLGRSSLEAATALASPAVAAEDDESGVRSLTELEAR